jgi:hypothetical protein
MDNSKILASLITQDQGGMRAKKNNKNKQVNKNNKQTKQMEKTQLHISLQQGP